MKSVPPPSCCGKIAAIFVFLISFVVLQPVAAAPESSLAGSSHRFAVPDAQADALWQFLSRQYQTVAFKKLHPKLSVQTQQQLYSDVYLDDANRSLLHNQAAVLLRKKHTDDAFTHVGLFLPEKLAEKKLQEFSVLANPVSLSENWLSTLTPEQREKTRSFLGHFGLTKTDLQTNLELQQNKRLIRILQNGEVILILTHQTVSTKKPACNFTEFEITKVAQTEAASWLYAETMEQVKNQFPLIRPETQSQYSKMAALHAERPQLMVSSTVGWLGLAFLFSSMSMLVLRRHRKRHI